MADKKKKSEEMTEETVNQEETVLSEEKVEKEPSEVEKATALAEEYKNKLYYVTAEYENFRRRNKEIASQKYNEGRADVLVKILPIGDNIDRALAVCNDEKMKQGLEMVKANFQKILSDEGVEEFDPVGEEFNPATAVAVMAQPAEEGQGSGMVKATFVKGYKKGDKILRFAQVVVTQ